MSCSSKYLTVFLALFLACAFPCHVKASAADAQREEFGPCISVGGSGEVQAVPDRLTLRCGVSERNKDIQAGSAAVGKILGKVLSFLKENGIADKDVQTSHVQIQREYQYENSQEPKFLHYLLSQSFSVVLDDPSRYEKIFEGLIALGINDVQELSFSLSDPKKYKDETLSLAVKDARRKAEILAGASGLSLGGVVSIQEGRQEYTVPRSIFGVGVSVRGQAMDSASGMGAGMALGTIPVNSEVTIVYRLK